jgi:hypothetical protein
VIGFAGVRICRPLSWVWRLGTACPGTTRRGSRATPGYQGLSAYRIGDHRAMIFLKAVRRSGPRSGNRGPEVCSMTAETAAGQAGGTPGGLAEPGPARPGLPDRLARYGTWVAVIAHIVLHDRRLQATVITGVIGMYALASVTKNNQARPVRRAAAWYNARAQVHDVKVLRGGRRALRSGRKRRIRG